MALRPVWDERTATGGHRERLFYHGTALANEPSIRRYGLRPSPAHDSNPSGRGPWVAPHYDRVAMMPAIRTVAHRLDQEGKLMDADIEPAWGLVISVRLPLWRLVPDPELVELQVPGGCSPSEIVEYSPVEVGHLIAIVPPDQRRPCLIGPSPPIWTPDTDDLVAEMCA